MQIASKLILELKKKEFYRKAVVSRKVGNKFVNISSAIISSWLIISKIRKYHI